MMKYLVSGVCVLNAIGLTVYLSVGLNPALVAVIMIVNIGAAIACYLSCRKELTRLIDLIGGSSATGSSWEQIASFITQSKVLSHETGSVFSGMTEIGNHKFYDIAKNISNDKFRESLVAANDKMIEMRTKESQTKWITEGVAAMAGLKQQNNDSAAYCYQCIVEIVNYLGANQGALFVLRDAEKEPWFELTAAYAYGKKKFVERRVNPGEGLIGQVYYDKEPIVMTEVPSAFVKITSGLGEALPRCVCIIPLLADGNIYGAFEVASFKKFEPHEIEYLKKVADTIGFTLHQIENRSHTETLLKESQTMAQELKSQEEELRQNMEELTATQEQMKRKQTELDAVMASMSTVELDLEGRVLQANEIFLGITGYSLKDIEGRPYKALIPQSGNDPIQYEMMWSSIRSGRSFAGEFRIVSRAGKEMWLVGNFTPILNEDGHPYKVMVISLFQTQDKDKVFELQEMIAALKNCFPIAELNPDLTFRSANDLFLSELGIKRIELKKMLPAQVLANDSFGKIQQYITKSSHEPGRFELYLTKKTGDTNKYESTLININSENRRKALLILRNTL